jgi:type IV pilus assembly protein PilA
MTRIRNGFTVIELLIVIVIIGILAAIAIPKFAGSKDRDYASAMTTDLRNLVTAEEAFFADSTKYTNNLSSLKFQSTSGVNAPTITLGPSAKAWSAVVTHTKTTTKCGIGVNTINPVATSDSSGTPQCK